MQSGEGLGQSSGDSGFGQSFRIIPFLEEEPGLYSKAFPKGDCPSDWFETFFFKLFKAMLPKYCPRLNVCTPQNSYVET